MSNLQNIETEARQFYIHRYDDQIYYQVYLLLEDWVSKTIFREDPSRVFLASNDYAFRRRFELTDMSEDYEKIQASSLRFPFANYWPLNSSWVPDKRMAGNPASMLYQGTYIGTTLVKTSSVTTNIPITFYFDREDDCRLAYNMLHFYTFNERPLKMEFIFEENLIEVPLIFKIENMKFNPQFNETDWLKQNRIFTITAEFYLRTYMINPPDQPNYKYSVDSQGNLIETDSGESKGFYDNGRERFKLTEQVILNLKNNYGLLTSTLPYPVEPIELQDPTILVDQFDVLHVPNRPNSRDVIWILHDPNDVIKITFNTNLNNPEAKTLYSRDLKNQEYLAPGCKYEDLEDGRRLFTFRIDNLNYESTYNIYLNLYSKRGTAKQEFKSFVTSEDPSTIEEIKEPKSALLGLSW